MSHFRASFIRGYTPNEDGLAAMVIEVDAPSPLDAAEVLFVSANKTNTIPTGVEVIEPLQGFGMTVGDAALVIDVNDINAVPQLLWCQIEGWKSLD